MISRPTRRYPRAQAFTSLYIHTPHAHRHARIHARNNSTALRLPEHIVSPRIKSPTHRSPTRNARWHSSTTAHLPDERKPVRTKARWHRSPTAHFPTYRSPITRKPDGIQARRHISPTHRSPTTRKPDCPTFTPQKPDRLIVIVQYKGKRT